MDFGFGGNGDKNTNNSDAPKTNADGSPITDLGTGTTSNDVNGEPADDINSISTTDDTGAGKTKTDTTKTDDKPADKQDDKPAGDNTTNTNDDLVAGSIIELGDNKYTVDATGNLVDEAGAIFKEAKDVKSWLATFDNVDDGSNELSITSIQELVGIDILGEDDKPVIFDNTPAGVKAYIDAVSEANRDQHYEEAINTLNHQYPFINDILNYYVANGNSLEGFGEVQDRSGITIDDTNEAQQENIIRTAWKEQNRKGDVEGYIAYLKSSGTLLATSKEELSGLQELDRLTKQQIADDAAEAEAARVTKLQKYWGGVQEVIKNKSIAGYQIPDTIIINKDGKKLSATPDDFFNYVYQVDNTGKSAYEKVLAAQDPKDRMEDEILRAYLKFVGGNYSNLVNMAVNKDKVKTLKLQAANRTTNSIKVTKPKTDNSKGVTDFGY